LTRAKTWPIRADLNRSASSLPAPVSLLFAGYPLVATATTKTCETAVTGDVCGRRETATGPDSL